MRIWTGRTGVAMSMYAAYGALAASSVYVFQLMLSTFALAVAVWTLTSKGKSS